MPEQLTLERIETPIGQMLVVSDNQARLRSLDWQDHELRFFFLLGSHYGALGTGYTLEEGKTPDKIREPLLAYFEGDLSAIDQIPTYTQGTDFYNEVWQHLRTIPAGTTLSYSQLAVKVGRPKAVRAVGTANAANPIGIVVPCHRVIGATGKLTGYGGGLERKHWLLAHEGASLV